MDALVLKNYIIGMRTLIGNTLSLTKTLQNKGPFRVLFIYLFDCTQYVYQIYHKLTTAHLKR